MGKKAVYTFENIDIERLILGPMNRHIFIIEEELDLKITITSQQLFIDDEADESRLLELIKVLKLLISQNITPKERDLLSIIMMIKKYSYEEVEKFFKSKKIIVNTYDGRAITTKGINQNIYLQYLNNADVIFATGSAGTGKTYLAVAFAISELKKNHFKKLIITRPVVEAGEKLGFLPGDFREKVDPYLIPIYDAIHDILGEETTNKMLEKKVIEIAPLAYMRGRTLDNSCIILDEAQNTTRNQMKMFLTRLGFSSKMIITGDITQIDLNNPKLSGLVEAINLLQDIKQIQMIHFEKDDVMRHPIVSKIISRYEEIEDV